MSKRQHGGPSAFCFFALALSCSARASVCATRGRPIEPRFALSAKQMVESGNWLILPAASCIRTPPLFMAGRRSRTRHGHWRVASCCRRCWCIGYFAACYDLARRLWDRRTGLFAAAAMLAALQFVYQAKRAQIDPTVTFFVTLANYGLLRHFLLGPNWRAYWLGCFAAGLGVITKGVGVLALFMFAPYIFARMRHWQNVTITQRSAGRWAVAPGLRRALACGWCRCWLRFICAAPQSW